VHSCPGGVQDATHSAGVDYAGLLPQLFELDVANFLSSDGQRTGPAARVRAGTQFNSPSLSDVRGRYRSNQSQIGISRRSLCSCAGSREIYSRPSAWHNRQLRICSILGDTSTARDLAFAKIAAHVKGTSLAERQITT
jgi:5-methyltetrahydropteroyltriglutamate--homocysteine methyltransferase